MKFDSLFSDDNDLHNNACLNFQKDMSHGYIYGYKKAADELVKKVNATALDQDYLVYPIVFLYRHHVELLLKKLLLLSIQLDESDEKVPTNHKIKDLWPRVKGFFRKFNGRTNDKQLKFIDKIMNEICQIDPESMNFRYSKDKDGNSPNENLKTINLLVFSQVIGEVSDNLETFEYQLNFELEHKWEYLASLLSQINAADR